ncbi:2TM domain-containing protein [Polaribacter vadi]|uniref:2TM domain-containing protein n=1 Tax=Polaribacter TaxID=52959 RepID=UPI001C0A6435|nr:MULTISPECIES: 2TM domain-containing protein [Polaribacter]MBU3012583.1 2TM domain-containing protein [Polaribacter vadi]MDO6742400.1 2TM domain-containing protein [Polaribacter sp. 1_MG-2023]
MDNSQKIKLQKAKQKVEAIKNFYKHVITYVLVNLFLTFVWSFKFKIFGDLIFSNQYNSEGFKHIPFWLVGGIFLLFDALRTFGFFTFFDKNWEERKIKEFME